MRPSSAIDESALHRTASRRSTSPDSNALDLRKSMYAQSVMDARETKNVSLGHTSLVVAASDGPGG